MTQPRIFFTRDGKRIPFSSWLFEQYRLSGKEWKEFDEILGVERVNCYCHSVSKGRPNNPTNKKFRQIITRLGFSEIDFEVTDMPHGQYAEDTTPEEFESALRRIADEAIARGWDTIRTPLVKAIGGEGFYIRYAKGPENMEMLVEKIRNLDSKKYGHLKCNPISQNKGPSKPLDPKETSIIETILLKSADSRGYGQINEMYIQIQQELASAGFTRTRPSLEYHVNRIWTGGRKKLKLSRMMPQSKKSLEASIEIEKNIKSNLPTFAWIAKASESHGKLVEYLVRNPDAIEHGLKLIGSEYKFEDGWARADIIYEDKNGDLLVVEVKQNAILLEDGYHNGLKGAEQIAGYRAALEFKSQHCPLLEGNRPNVRGMLVAYKISENIIRTMKNLGLEYKLINAAVKQKIEGSVAAGN